MHDVQAQFTIMGMWNAATPIGKGVVIVLLIMSAWSLTIAIERLWRFHKAKKESLQVAVAITPLLKEHKLDEAIRFAKDGCGSPKVSASTIVICQPPPRSPSYSTT